jgi:hypothetical protein
MAKVKVKAKKKSGSEARQLTQVLRFRATDAEVTTLTATADDENVSVSSYIRARVFKGTANKVTRPRQRTTPDAELFARFLGQIGKCGNNLNQIAHRLNSDEKVPRAMIVKALADLGEISTPLLKALGK